MGVDESRGPSGRALRVVSTADPKRYRRAGLDPSASRRKSLDGRLRVAALALIIDLAEPLETVVFI